MSKVVLTVVREGIVESAADFLRLAYLSHPDKKKLAATIYPDVSIETAKSELSRKINNGTATMDEARKILIEVKQLPAFVEWLSKVEEQ